MLKMLMAAALLAGAAPRTEPATTPPAPPAPPAPAPALDHEAIAEARTLLRASGFETQFEEATNRIAEDTFATMMRELETRYGEPVPAELRTRLHSVMMENIANILADLRPTALEDSARVYARHFTAAEIRELRQLQTHPVMIKVQRIAPQLTSDLMQIGVAASARRMPEATERLRREFEAWERDHRRRRPRVG